MAEATQTDPQEDPQATSETDSSGDAGGIEMKTKDAATPTQNIPSDDEVDIKTIISQTMMLDSNSPTMTINTKQEKSVLTVDSNTIDKSEQKSQQQEVPLNTSEDAKQEESDPPKIPATTTDNAPARVSEAKEILEEKKSDDESKPPVETEKQSDSNEEEREDKESAAENKESVTPAVAKEQPAKPAEKEHPRSEPRAPPRNPLQQSPARLQAPPKSHASTEIVHSMFGPSVGNCWGDHSCQYNHVRGRLYACAEAVLFYSNIFGFEKKINLSFDSIIQMSLYRQTSILVMAQEENDDNNEMAGSQYVFKGFSDRSQTLAVLIKLWRQQRGEEGTQAPAGAANENPQESSSNMALSPSRPLSPASEVETQGQAPPSAMKTPTPSRSPARATSSGNNPILMPELPSRKRSKSVPNLNRRPNRDRSQSQGASSDAASIVGAPVENDDGMDFWNISPTQSDRLAWKAAKQSAAPYIKEVGIESFELPCSLVTFYKLFLANDAEYSMEMFHSGEDVKDLDVKVVPWAQDPNHASALLRTMTFKHPCGSFGVGPSHANTKKKFKLRRFPGLGICIDCSTTVEGLPASDCFYVGEFWIIEAVGNGRVRLSARFGANFVKRHFLRSIITKNVQKGNGEWFDGYKRFLQSASLPVGNEEEAPSSDGLSVEMEEVPDVTKEAGSSGSSDPFQQLPLNGKMLFLAMMTFQIALLLLLVFIVRELRVSHEMTENLMQEMTHLRLEHGKILDLLLEGQKQQREE